MNHDKKLAFLPPFGKFRVSPEDGAEDATCMSAASSSTPNFHVVGSIEGNIEHVSRQHQDINSKTPPVISMSGSSGQVQQEGQHMHEQRTQISSEQADGTRLAVRDSHFEAGKSETRGETVTQPDG